ncbi:hypothetical protein PilKf_00281 [Pillotina sp. SPG140]
MIFWALFSLYIEIDNCLKATENSGCFCVCSGGGVFHGFEKIEKFKNINLDKKKRSRYSTLQIALSYLLFMCLLKRTVARYASKLILTTGFCTRSTVINIV